MNAATFEQRWLEKPQRLRELQLLSFYVLVPLALAAITATETGFNRILGYSGAMIYVSLLSLVPWWVAEATTRLAKLVLSRWQPPLWALTVIGALLASIIVHPYVSFTGSWFFPYWTDGAVVQASARMSRDDAFAETFMQVGRAALFWTAANYIFDRYLGLPRFRFASSDDFAASPQQTVGAPVRFLERLHRFRSAEDIWIVKAEEQYIRVIGAAGDEMVLYRFNRAVIDLASEDGFRVHRSYWVRRSAVLRPTVDGRQLFLEMEGGFRVPVSKRYHALVQQILG